MLEPTKKDILHPKTETQRDGRRGAIMVKSNPILATWAIQTEKLLETFSHKSESSEPHIRLPCLARGVWQWRRRPQRITGPFEGQGFPNGSLVKNLPAKQETQVRSLGWEDPLEESMATHSSTLAWRSPWIEEPGRLQPIGQHRVGHNCSN